MPHIKKDPPRKPRLRQSIAHMWRDEKGFSLIEVSFALVIIGLLVGAIFKGTALIETMQLKSVVKAVDGYRLATQFFIDQYGQLPGDFSKASEHIDSDLKNGNGNGIIEGPGCHRESEAFWFWQHLGAAGFIAHPGVLPTHQQPHFGHGLPKAKTGGGYTIYHNGGTHPTMQGLWIILGKKSGLQGTGALLTPKQSLYILQQFGEEDPSTGLVRVLPGNDVPPGSCLSGQTLNYKTHYPACIIYFKL